MHRFLGNRTAFAQTVAAFHFANISNPDQIGDVKGIQNIDGVAIDSILQIDIRIPFLVYCLFHQSPVVVDRVFDGCSPDPSGIGSNRDRANHLDVRMLEQILNRLLTLAPAEIPVVVEHHQDGIMRRHFNQLDHLAAIQRCRIACRQRNAPSAHVFRDSFDYFLGNMVAVRDKDNSSSWFCHMLDHRPRKVAFIPSA